ncbi:MAG: UDP-N-acetylmuramate--L-alanine ligase [Lachnospiraceae bacterium]|nr:UDP-N-acetylmuramate--L-alanine ligase [Lachnospiraceae bacterium]
MYQIDFRKPQHIHFIGIGGISMSGLAEVLLKRGFTISGSDNAKSSLTEKLIEQGATVYYGQKASNVTEGIDAVVYTAAIHEDNPEFAACVEKKLPMMTRAELLGQLMKNYELPIAIAGTHGKTTTTSMLSEVLMAMDTDPTLTIGGMLKSIGGNIRIGSSQIFVAEACEYTNSFLSLFPRIGMILNVDADHLDFFKDIDQIRESFHAFAKLLPEEGLLLLQADTPKKEEITKDLSCNILTFAIRDEGGDSAGETPDVYATDLTFDENGRASYQFHMGTEKLRQIAEQTGYSLSPAVKSLAEKEDVLTLPVSLGVVGSHNVCNSLPVIATALLLGGETDKITSAVAGFTGTDRRFEYKGSIGDVTIIDDYAHHPTEIKATLRAALKYPHKKLFVAFQPHTYTRTKALLTEFADALSLADEVVLADIYAAREKNTIGITSETLLAELEKRNVQSAYFPTFDEIENYLLEKCQPGDLLITMGAGDICKIGDHLLGK